MPLSSRVSALGAGALLTASFVAMSVPQSAYGQPAGLRSPQFVATAVGFKALHETHSDWIGSDEVYVVFSDVNAGPDSTTKIYGDVDAGESRTFLPTEQCVAPRPACDRGAPEVHFKLTMWENDDDGFAHGQLSNSHAYLDNGKYEGDDLIGRAEVGMNRDQLVADLPNVGMSKEYTVKPVGGDGSYELTYKITRLANALNIPPIGPPVALGISLQAMAVPIRMVHLTWSGASTASVDIYRDGSKVTTTANDGDHTTPSIQPGMYQYRVCELNSTTACSPDVPVTVS